MISKEETEHIAKLARLGLSEEEIAKYQKDLSSILEYIEQLNKVDVCGVEPFTHSIGVSNVTRPDIKHRKPKDRTDKLLKLMPEEKDGYLKVKSVF